LLCVSFFSTMSGKSNEDQKLKDSAIVQAQATAEKDERDRPKSLPVLPGAPAPAAAAAAAPSAEPALNKASLPTAAKSSLAAVGFKPMKVKDDGFDSDSDDNVSEMSFEERPPGPIKTLPTLPGASEPARRPTVLATNIPPPPIPVEQPNLNLNNGQRRGSLLDATGAVSNMLNAVKRTADSDSDGGDDWD
jgi:hypothetical protein